LSLTNKEHGHKKIGIDYNIDIIEFNITEDRVYGIKGMPERHRT